MAFALEALPVGGGWQGLLVIDSARLTDLFTSEPDTYAHSHPLRLPRFDRTDRKHSLYFLSPPYFMFGLRAFEPCILTPVLTPKWRIL